MKRRPKIGMKAKLLVTFLAASILSFAIAGWFGNHLTASLFIDKTFSQLESVRQGKKRAVEALFKNMGNQLHTLAEDRMTIAALSEFSAQFQTLLPQSGINDARLERMRQGLRSYYLVDFDHEYRYRNDNRTPDVLPYLSGLSPIAIALQYLYIADNPNLPDDKALQDRADGEAGYHKVHARYHPLFHDYLTRFGFEDILLVDANSDAVVYSVAKHIDFGASLDEGLLASSGLGAACRQAKQSGGPEVTFVDFGLYEPVFGTPVCFLAMPVQDEGRKVGVLVFAVSSQMLSELMLKDSSLGLSGEAYLVGPDKLPRSDSRLDPFRFGVVESLRDPGAARVASNIVARALEGKSGQDIAVDYRGESVLSSYAPIHIFDRVWALLVEIDQSEALLPVGQMNTSMGMVGLTLLAAMALMALFVATRFSSPLVKASAFAEAITAGDYQATLRLSGRDEAGALARALNQMARSLREQDWLKSGKGELNDQMRGELNVEELGRRCIAFFVRHLEAQLGAFYLLQEGHLVLTASYAFCDRRGNLNRIAMGEGLVGQSALEQEMLVFQRPAGNVPILHYGIDQTVPEYFLCAPIVFESALIGVVQIGSAREFTPLMRQFIVENIESVAISLHSALIRAEVQDLLTYSQEQAEALAGQHAQLKRANSELQAQAKVLRASEESLQAQQEELRVANEELAERTHVLEEQRNAIRNKNVQLKKAHTEIRRKAQELELASKYKSEFLANMSHELRTPLNSILILSQLLKENPENNLTDKQLEFANTIYSSGAGLLSLINEVLDLSKVEAGKMEIEVKDIELNSLAEGLLRTFAPIAASKGLQMNVEIAPALPPCIRGDGRRIQQIIHNLLTNALKFTEQGGVLVSIARPEEDMDLSHCGLSPSQAVAISVTDTGIGIPAEKQSLIFEAFQQADGTTSRKYGGTGLGLAISREFSILLGGEIQLVSAPGEGSTFTLILPQEFTPQINVDITGTTSSEPITCYDPESACQPKPDHPTDDRDHVTPGDKTLLIIEDDPNFSHILGNLGHEKGFKCIIAPDGEQGLDLANSLTPSAIILDIGLPGISGMKVIDQLKDAPRTRHIPIHVISAFDESLEALRMGAIGYLTKPVSMEQLNEVFTRIDDLISRPVKKLLIVEDDPAQCQAIIELIGNNDVQSLAVSRGDEAWALLQQEPFDCIILDLELADMPGVELLERIDANSNLARIPIIIYTGRDITPKEEARLARLSDSIIIKGVRSPERLLDETSLFLHRVQANLSQDKQRILKKVHDRQFILEDKKILIIDDDRRNIYSIAAVLENHGMKVLSGDTGKECLAKLEQNSDVDLVLMDIMMPEMDGYEAIRSIRQDPRFKGLPIIALTAKAMLGDRSKCIEAGANDYLAKPVDTDKLLSLLRVWLYK